MEKFTQIRVACCLLLMQLFLRMRDGRSRPVLRRSAWAKAASRLNFVNIRNRISQRKEKWLKKARLQEPWFSINQRRFISSGGAILGGTLRHGDQQVKNMQLLLQREANRYQASSFNLILQVSAPNCAQFQVAQIRSAAFPPSLILAQRSRFQNL